MTSDGALSMVATSSSSSKIVIVSINIKAFYYNLKSKHLLQIKFYRKMQYSVFIQLTCDGVR